MHASRALPGSELLCAIRRDFKQDVRETSKGKQEHTFAAREILSDCTLPAFLPFSNNEVSGK